MLTTRSTSWRTLLSRCGVATEGAQVYEYPVRRAASSYPAATDALPRIEVRLLLPDGLSLDGAELLFANYAVEGSEDVRRLTLRPYEARVYRLRWRTHDA